MPGRRVSQNFNVLSELPAEPLECLDISSERVGSVPGHNAQRVERRRSFQAAAGDVTGVSIDDQEVRFVERPLLLDWHVKAVAISSGLCEGCLPCKIVPDSSLA